MLPQNNPFIHSSQPIIKLKKRNPKKKQKGILHQREKERESGIAHLKREKERKRVSFFFGSQTSFSNAKVIQQHLTLSENAEMKTLSSNPLVRFVNNNTLFSWV